MTRPPAHAAVSRQDSLPQRFGARLRQTGRSVVGSMTRFPPQQEWLQFLFYHLVMEDQRAAFRNQLAFLRQHGDFIGIDEAVAGLESASGIGGRYFCLTFDDGFRNCMRNVVPILAEMKLPAAFFVPTKYIGLDLAKDWRQIAPFYERSWRQAGGPFEFLSWDECRQIAAAGFAIGSHTHSHRRLTTLSLEDAREELALSKQLIEMELSRPCAHFCCPWGKVNRDFNPAFHPSLARELGYQSFLTAEEGVSLWGDSPFYVRRTGCEPDLSPAAVRYALFSRFSLRRSWPPGAPSVALRRNASPGRLAASRGHQLSVSEPEPVEVLKFPYPFQAAFTVASDIDSASIGRFCAVHALFCETGLIRPGTSTWRILGLDSDYECFSAELGGIPGLGLDLADSFFLVGDRTTFGMYRQVEGQPGFHPDTQAGLNCRELIRDWLREEKVDSLHALLHYTREDLAPLLHEFYGWCEREGVPKPSIWINHSLSVTPTGLCPGRLQPGSAGRWLRWARRRSFGPLLGRRALSLREAFAKYEGDRPGSPHYVNDLLAANGVRYVWLNMDDLRRNRIALPETRLNGRPTILRPVTMDDGVRYYRFERCYGKPSGVLGGESYLRDSSAGFDASVLINESNLETLCRSAGTCILYVHWTHHRSFPLSGATLSRFELLRRWRDAGRVWVTSTSALLEWTRRRTFLRVNCHRQGPRLVVELEGVDDPIFGREALSPAQLNGLCLRLAAERELAVAVNGHVLAPNQIRRSGELLWLDLAGASRGNLRRGVSASDPNEH